MHHDPTRPVLHDDFSVAIRMRAGTIGDGMVVFHPGEDGYVEALQSAIDSGELSAADTARAYQSSASPGGPKT